MSAALVKVDPDFGAAAKALNLIFPRTTQSLRTAIFALAANLGTALAKLLAALVTRSSAMLAEAFHAFADSGNEVLLLIAERRSGRGPDEQHPLGHGRAAYFWGSARASPSMKR